MELSAVHISSFRSINDQIKLSLDRKMTVLVGANDHGKSNVLLSLKFLNDEYAPEADDVYTGNSPASQSEHAAPLVLYGFDLTQKEVEELPKKLLSFTPTVNESWSADDEKTVKEYIKKNLSECVALAQSKFWLSRTTGQKIPGYSSKVEHQNSKLVYFINRYLYHLARMTRPRVVFLDHSPTLPYKIPIESFNESTDSVLKGLIRLGGFHNKGALLTVDNNSGRKAIKQFNLNFNREFRSRYKQYKKVEWTLALTTSATELTLEVSDHAMELGNPMNRSLGFRSWLAFLLALYGETGNSATEGCLIVIDEPDVHLHPRGQKDMLHYLEELSDSNMIVFATHSPFMVPRRFPQRVRQVIRKQRGTVINENPYKDTWLSVVNDLGVAVPDMFRFADNYLVVEGESDSLLMTALIGIAERKQFEFPDLDEFAVRWHDGASFVPNVVRAIDDGEVNILAVVDDDKAGVNAKNAVVKLGRSKVKAVTLSDLGYPAGSSIEDVVPSSAVLEVMTLLLSRMTDIWQITEEKKDEALSKLAMRIDHHPRKEALVESLVDSGCLTDKRDYPSRQFSNCAAGCIINGDHAFSEAEEKALRSFCGYLKKWL